MTEKVLTFTLVSGEKIEGAIRWFDEVAIHLVTPERDEITVFLHSVAMYKA